MLKKVDRSKEKPIVFRDGVRVDMSSVNDQWIDGDVLKEQMKYISRMTEGLVTGTMSNDEDYIKLKNKIIGEMIDDKVISLKKRLCVEAEKKSCIYDHAEMVQDKILKKYNDRVKQIAKDNLIEICFNKLTGECEINRNPSPISYRTNDHNYEWDIIDAKTLKEEIKKRRIGKSKNKFDDISGRFLKEIEEELKAQKKADCPFDLENPNCNSKVANSKYEKTLKNSKIYKKLKKKSVKKKLAKKKVAKKKVNKKAKKKDRR